MIPLNVIFHSFISLSQIVPWQFNHIYYSLKSSIQFIQTFRIMHLKTSSDIFKLSNKMHDDFCSITIECTPFVSHKLYLMVCLASCISKACVCHLMPSSIFPMHMHYHCRQYISKCVCMCSLYYCIFFDQMSWIDLFIFLYE